MNKAVEVLNYLIPQGGWILVGEEYSGITFSECEPISEAEFNDALKNYDKIVASIEKDNAAKKSALLEKLGITADEAKLLLA